MSRQVQSDLRTWKSHPVRAFGIRAAAFLIPLAVSIVAGLVVGALLPEPDSTTMVVLWWVAVLASSTLALYGADRLTRRLLPLATLMRLSMLFPDHAPSRVKLARRVTGSRAIAVELERAGRAGRTGDRQQAAETILALVGALGDYDSRTRGHSERTQLFVTLLADELKLKAEDKGRLMWAALVHDIGKLKVPTEVLNKPGRPTEDEWATLHSHPDHGAEICEPLRSWLGEWWYAIEQHHEKYDGSGYPRGLAGSEISYGARIVAVADSYEVMTAARPYKRPMTAEAARQELTRCAGTQFDPDVVRAFLNISLGRISRGAGPIAWIAQILMVRPGPLLGQLMGGAAGAAAAAAAAVGLNLAPTVEEVPVAAPQAPAATAPATPGPSQQPTAAPTRAPQRPAKPAPSVGPTAVPAVVAPSPTPSAEPVPVEAPTEEPAEKPAEEPTEEPVVTPTPVITLTPAPTPVAMALADDAGSLLEDTTAELHVLANDTAGGHGPLRVGSVTRAAHGTATRTVDNTVRYVPDPDYAGPDSFTYTALDRVGTSRTATVRVEVLPVQDPPVAVDDVHSQPEDSVDVTLSLLANDRDPDGDPLTVTSVTGALRGTVVSRPNGSFGYTPDPDFHGSETLSYQVSDGQGGTATGIVRVTVTPVNDPPRAFQDVFRFAEDSAEQVWDLAANDTDVDGDALTVTSVTGAVDGTVTSKPGGLWGYTPNADFHGSETLTYTVSDGNGGSDTGTVQVTVDPAPDAPVAVDDAFTFDEDSAEQVWDLAANDVDVDGDSLTVTALVGASNGTLENKGAGLWGYTPDENYNGTETLTYTVDDGTGRTDTGTVDVTVDPVNDPPVAGPDAYSADVGQLLSVDAANGVLSNDSDIDGDPIRVNGDDSADVVIGPDGAFTYTTSVAITETVTYWVTDDPLAPPGTGTPGTLTITATAGPPVVTRLYLQSVVSRVVVGILDTVVPGGGVFDWDGDGKPGLTIKSSSTKLTETDTDKFQIWSYPVTGGITLNGPITLDLWTKLEKGANKDLDYAAWVFDCDSEGGNCSLIASAVDIHIDNWSTSTQWQKRRVTVGSATNRLVADGRTLRVRLAFDHSDVWLPLGDDPSTPGANEAETSLNYTG